MDSIKLTNQKMKELGFWKGNYTGFFFRDDLPHGICIDWKEQKCGFDEVLGETIFFCSTEDELNKQIEIWKQKTI